MYKPKWIRDLAARGYDFALFCRAQKFFSDRGISLCYNDRLRTFVAGMIGGKGNGDCWCKTYRFNADEIVSLMDAPSTLIAMFPKR